MRHINIDPSALGLSDDDVKTAAKVALAIHDAARDLLKSQNRPVGYQALAAVGVTLLPIAGRRKKNERFADWQEWLRTQRKCTVAEARAAHARICGGSYKQTTLHHLRRLEELGLIRYVRADCGDPGLVVWIGDAHTKDADRAQGPLQESTRIDSKPKSLESHALDRTWLTSREFADRIGVTEHTVIAWRNRGRGPKYTRISTRCVRYAITDIDAWLASFANGEKP